MAKSKSKLKNALNRQLGKDPIRDKLKRISRRQPKKRESIGDDKMEVEEWEDADEEGEDDEEVPELVDTTSKRSAAAEESEDKDEEEEEEDEGEDDEDDEDEGEDDIALSDIDDDDLEIPDLLPHQKLTINNHSALIQVLERIALPLSSLPFAEHQSVTTDAPVEIKHVDDDLKRELAFYKQALDAVNIARKKLTKEGVPFSRPTDYFAEMLKDDEHMGLIKQKLLDEAANKKAAAEARRQRDLKKFGKQVQFAKLEERNKAKKDTLEKIQVLKRKRQGADTEFTNESDMFDVALEDAVASSGRKDKRDRDPSRASRAKRQKKDQKYGHGGKKRFSKSGDAESTADLSGFSAKRNKSSFAAGKKRPGKSKRANAR
ncbi:eukaryotic rRNA processing protein EBP2-domain-containing protein [Morchella snyderi]|nr:eukaryotic rRNA processing protein EBP2-domain-containing protein [Morchella snyderi]